MVGVVEDTEATGLLATTIDGAQEVPDAGTSRPQSRRPSPNPHKMDPQDLAELNHIFAEISIPGWLGRIATNFGTAGHGTPKADEWRASGTVYLPMGLIHMWHGRSDKYEDLKWFLDLATAVHLATKRSTSAAFAKAYLVHLRRYLHGLVERGFSLMPNHHAALHLGDFLPDVGPVRSWWAYPIERQVGLLQKINTNNRYGIFSHLVDF